jgi:hypothetical protein
MLCVGVYPHTTRVMQLIKGDFGRIIMVIIVLPKAIISDQIEGLIYSVTKLVSSVAEFSKGHRVNCKFMKCICV